MRQFFRVLRPSCGEVQRRSFLSNGPSFETVRDAAQVMGVNVKTMGKESLKQRYVELVKQHHPDAGGDSDIMSRVTQANEVLSQLTSEDCERFAYLQKYYRPRSRFERFKGTHGVPRPQPSQSTSSTETSPPGDHPETVNTFSTAVTATPEPSETVDGSITCSVDQAGKRQQRWQLGCGAVAACLIGMASVTDSSTVGPIRSVFFPTVSEDRSETISNESAQQVAVAESEKRARVAKLHQQRAQLNQQISYLRRHARVDAIAADELRSLIQVRDAINAEIETCAVDAATKDRLARKGRGGGSETLSVGMSAGLLALVLLLPRFCRVASIKSVKR